MLRNCLKVGKVAPFLCRICPLRNVERTVVLNRYMSNSNADQSADVKTHFGYETVTEKEKEEKGEQDL